MMSVEFGYYTISLVIARHSLEALECYTLIFCEPHWPEHHNSCFQRVRVPFPKVPSDALVGSGSISLILTIEVGSIAAIVPPPSSEAGGTVVIRVVVVVVIFGGETMSSAMRHTIALIW